MGGGTVDLSVESLDTRGDILAGIEFISLLVGAQGAPHEALFVIDAIQLEV